MYQPDCYFLILTKNGPDRSGVAVNARIQGRIDAVRYILDFFIRIDRLVIPAAGSNEAAETGPGGKPPCTLMRFCRKAKACEKRYAGCSNSQSRTLSPKMEAAFRRFDLSPGDVEFLIRMFLGS